MGPDDSGGEAARRRHRDREGVGQDRKRDRDDRDERDDRRGDRRGDREMDRLRDERGDSYENSRRGEKRDEREEKGDDGDNRDDKKDRRDRDRRDRREHRGHREQRKHKEHGEREHRGRQDHGRRKSRSRSPGSSKRQRREDSEERSDRRRREHRDRRPRDDSGDRSDSERPRKAIEPLKQSGPLPDQADAFAVAEGGEPPPPPKEKPNLGTTGALAAASNAVTQADGSVITLKYHEPPEARKPAARDQWRLYVFKDGAIVDTVDLGARSCWLAGRDTAVVDLLAAHPSISKQHAVLQFRFVEKRNEFGDRIGRVKPYLLDLASANGTTLNHEPVAAQRYIELRDKDLVQFGHSTREYVLMLAPKE